MVSSATAPPRLRDRAAIDDRVRRAVLQAGHEVDARPIERGEPGEVHVSPIHDQDRAARVRALAHDRDLVLLAVRDHQRGRQAAVMVQGDVQLHRALRPPKCRPASVDTQIPPLIDTANPAIN